MTFPDAPRLLLVIGLSAFFGAAFESHYAPVLPNRPGGIRSFPLLAMCGALLFILEPHTAIPFTAGILVVGAWTYAYYRATLPEDARTEGTSHFIVPVCNMLVYALGAFTLVAPMWASIGVTVAAVLLLAGRRRLHLLAQTVALSEILTAAQFLLLIGVVLPLLPRGPAIPGTGITPYHIWLAVVAVSGLSYGSYLLARYVFPERGTLLGGVLGGLYSSTATTVVLAKRLAEQGRRGDLQAGILFASAVMYVRLAVIIGIFSVSILRAVVIPLLVLCALGCAAGFLLLRTDSRNGQPGSVPDAAENPLEISTALLFAAAFVVVSFVTHWAKAQFGNAGLFALSAIVGITDIDPFVLSLVQGSAQALAPVAAAAAVLIAAASNDAVKAAYALIFGKRNAARTAAALGALAILTLAAALIVWRSA